LRLPLKDKGYLSEAAEKYRQSLELSKQIHDRIGVARTLGNLAEILLIRGDVVGTANRFEAQLNRRTKLSEGKQGG